MSDEVENLEKENENEDEGEESILKSDDLMQEIEDMNIEDNSN